MHLTHRRTEVQDLEALVGLLPDRFAYGENLLARLPVVSGQLLTSKSMISSVVEDQDRPRNARILGFGASVFVTPQFMHQARSDPVPHLGRRVISKILCEESPVLGPAAILRANSRDGLHLLILYHGRAEHMLKSEDMFLVGSRLIQAYMEDHRGYNLKEILAEVIGEESLQWSVGSGAYRLRSDYLCYYESRSLPLPPPHLRPYLIGLTREEALSTEGLGTVLSPLFIHTPPRFFFKTVEQELLKRALVGETDKELASTLNISLSAVKKRWAAIYERVADRQSDLLPVTTEDSLTEHKRGPEKRHRLLHYLQQHPEELRPVEPPRHGKRRQVAL